MQYSDEFPHPDTGRLIDSHTSSCCSTSVSFHYDIKEQRRCCTCSNCRKECKEVIKPRWIITTKGKYKEIIN